MAIVVVLQNRDGLRGYLETRATAANGDVTARLLRLLARGWHLLAIAYCVALFGMWVARPEDALAFMLQATAESVVEIVLGVLVGGLITRAITGGLRLPEEIKLRLPLLETRLNAFVPAVLQVVRLLVLLAVMLLIARAWGLFDVVAWAATAAGQDVVARALGVAFILLVAALLWLALSSWVEYRLNPNAARAPGPRERTLLALLRNAATIAIAAVTVMLVLSEIGVNIGPLLAGAGVLGLTIGFGAQKLVQDIITGVFIQFENAINEGEVVTADQVMRDARRLLVGGRAGSDAVSPVDLTGVGRDDLPAVHFGQAQGQGAFSHRGRAREDGDNHGLIVAPAPPKNQKSGGFLF
jgi:small conductance mechanosensitive channel